MMKKFFTIIFCFVSLIAAAQTDADVENYNYVLGTQTIGPKYKFTTDDALLETAKAIYDMGSRSMKISLSVSSYLGVSGSYSTLTSLVRDNTSFRQTIDMPFRNYFFSSSTHLTDNFFYYRRIFFHSFIY